MHRRFSTLVLALLVAVSGLLAGTTTGASAADLFYDDFGRPDGTDLGPDWSEESTGDLAIQGEQLVNPLSSHGAARAVGIASDAVAADVFSSPGGLRYAGVLVGYASVDDNVMVKVQDQQSNDGQFDTLFVYRGVMGSSIANASLTPFSGGRLSVVKSGTSIEISIDTDFDGTPDQTYPYSLGVDTGGDGVGVVAYGGGRVDDVAAGPVPQTIAFTASPPNPAPVGTVAPVQASASSGLAVSVTSLTPDACTVDAGQVSYVGVGTCTVRAEQAGGDAHLPASAQVSATVVKRATQVAVGLSDSAITYGESLGVQATVTSTDGETVGSLQARLDGSDSGAPVAYTGPDQDLGDLTPPAGVHSVGAEFTPTDGESTEGSSGSATVLVEKAPTVADVSVDGDSADITVTAAFGTPEGDVAFAVNGEPAGSRTLSGGSASLPVDLAPGDTVAAVYGGSASYLGSAASTAKSSPTITAGLSSATGPSSTGWYSRPVTVTFSCTAHGSPLTAPCPGPVVVDSDGPLQTVQRTVTAEDGGVGVVSVQVSLDGTAPSVSLHGIKRGPLLGSPVKRAECVGADPLSGLVSCTLSSSRVSPGTVRLTATARDAAGNESTAERRVAVARTVVLGAPYAKGAYALDRGTSYTLVALGGRRPYFRGIGATSTKVAFYPAGRMNGQKRWQLGITVPAAQTLGKTELLVSRGATVRIPVRVHR